MQLGLHFMDDFFLLNNLSLCYIYEMCPWPFVSSLTSPKSLLSHVLEPGGPCVWNPKTSVREVRTPFLPTWLYLRSELTALKDTRTEWFLSVPLSSSTRWRYNFAHVSVHSEVTCRRTSRMGFPRVQGNFVSPKFFLRKFFQETYICELI